MEKVPDHKEVQRELKLQWKVKNCELRMVFQSVNPICLDLVFYDITGVMTHSSNKLVFTSTNYRT